MKTFALTLLLTASFFIDSYGQDVLTYKNGNESKVKIIELNPTEVKFKRADNPDGPVYTVSKSELFMIRYENGAKEVLSGQSATETSVVTTDASQEALGYERIRYNGPRVGLTVFTDGSFKQHLREKGYSPFISQFGWQLETRLISTPKGTTGLIEWVFLVGGVEKGLFLPSATMLFGLRHHEGFEFGVGPNVSVTGFGLAIAAGTSIRSGRVVFPINLAIVPSVQNSLYSDTREATGLRASLLVGFNTRVR